VAEQGRDHELLVWLYSGSIAAPYACGWAFPVVEVHEGANGKPLGTVTWTPPLPAPAAGQPWVRAQEHLTRLWFRIDVDHPEETVPVSFSYSATGVQPGGHVLRSRWRGTVTVRLVPDS